MMKHLFVFLLFVVFEPSAMMAQKCDNTWIFSFNTQMSPSGIPGTRVNFTPELIFVTDTFGASCGGGCATMSDSTGSLLFFTNGINIYYKDGSILENGDYINPGVFNDQYAIEGYPAMQSRIILPSPDKLHSYHIFHVGIGPTENYGAPGLKLYSSQVVISPSTGIPKVIKKNAIIFSDTLGKN